MSGFSLAQRWRNAGPTLAPDVLNAGAASLSCGAARGVYLVYFLILACTLAKGKERFPMA